MFRLLKNQGKFVFLGDGQPFRATMVLRGRFTRCEFSISMESNLRGRASASEQGAPYTGR
jgi:hypothetical protein